MSCACPFFPRSGPNFNYLICLIESTGQKDTIFLFKYYTAVIIVSGRSNFEESVAKPPKITCA